MPKSKIFIANMLIGEGENNSCDGYIKAFYKYKAITKGLFTLQMVNAHSVCRCEKAFSDCFIFAIS